MCCNLEGVKSWFKGSPFSGPDLVLLEKGRLFGSWLGTLSSFVGYFGYTKHAEFFYKSYIYIYVYKTNKTWDAGSGKFLMIWDFGNFLL